MLTNVIKMYIRIKSVSIIVSETRHSKVIIEFNLCKLNNSDIHTERFSFMSIDYHSLVSKLHTVSKICNILFISRLTDLKTISRSQDMSTL
jgi:hypothetical protein